MNKKFAISNRYLSRDKWRAERAMIYGRLCVLDWWTIYWLLPARQLISDSQHRTARPYKLLLAVHVDCALDYTV